ncbi:MAG: hypothetical protein OEZ22_00925 [Spirochaetia bacterium]|nr:hypothetical protein [Spirochaetia bacterium]
MLKCIKILSFIIFVFLFIINIYSSEGIYRPYDLNRPGARSAGAGATGTSNIESLGSVSNNPAFLAEIYKPAFALGLDAQTRITSIQTNVSLKPQYLPVVAAAFPIGYNAGMGILIYSPFQRYFPDSDFIFYNMEPAFAYTFHRNLNMAITAGPAFGMQNKEFDGWGFTYSLSLLFRSKFVDSGLLLRPGTKITYETYVTGKSAEERTPHFIKGGITYKFELIKIALEAEYTNWDYSYFKENNINLTPAFEKGFLGKINPHIGFDFALPFWQGLNLRAGIFTEDFYDFEGKNDKQILLTFGFGGLAGSNFWEERLKIDFSLISAFIPSFFWEESHQIEKFQLTFEFIY